MSFVTRVLTNEGIILKSYPGNFGQRQEGKNRDTIANLVIKHLNILAGMIVMDFLPPLQEREIRQKHTLIPEQIILRRPEEEEVLLPPSSENFTHWSCISFRYPNPDSPFAFISLFTGASKNHLEKIIVNTRLIKKSKKLDEIGNLFHFYNIKPTTAKNRNFIDLIFEEHSTCVRVLILLRRNYAFQPGWEAVLKTNFLLS